MGHSLRPTVYNSINWPGLREDRPSVVDKSQWVQDGGRRLGSGSMGGAAAATGSPGNVAGGDHYPVRASAVAGIMPFAAQPGGQRNAGLGKVYPNGVFVPARDVSRGHQGSQGGTTSGAGRIGVGVASPGAGTNTMPGVYGPGQYGSPAQNPRQPYRANAGILIQNRMYPRPLPLHLYGGAATLGVPAQQALTQQMAAILSLRRNSSASTKPPSVPSSLLGSGIGSRASSMVGAAFSKKAVQK